MIIETLLENISNCELKPLHGLSLYIETKNHKILYDFGPDRTFLDNAKLKNIDLSKVDIAILSHGHADHGGGISEFLEINTVAKIYIQRAAFEPHYHIDENKKSEIGIDIKFKDHPQVILVDGDYKIDEELELFLAKSREKCYSPANDFLYENDSKDTFSHEQNLIIKENKTVMISGCCHSGIVNVMDAASIYNPDICIGGYHLYDPVLKKTVSTDILDEIAEELKKYKDTKLYTCHCTGTEAFDYLSKKLENLSYLHCGDKIEV